MAIIELDRIEKSFSSGLRGKKHVVLSGLSLSIERGEAFGLLGHNGAGKTTTMHVILGLLRPTSGRVRLFGENGATCAARARIGYLGDDVGLQPHFNADETLQFAGELCRMGRAILRERKGYLLDLVGLGDAAGLRVKKYSKGMRQRLGVALALLHNPELLILDEPYSGLDPIGRRELRQLLLALKDEGKTILLSSHIVPDVEAVCDRVGILSGGCIERCLALKDIYDHKRVPVEVVVRGVDRATLEDIAGSIEEIYHHGEATAVRCKTPGTVRRIVSKVYEVGGEVLEIKPLKFSLEDHLVETLALAPADHIGEAVPHREEKVYVGSR